MPAPGRIEGTQGRTMSVRRYQTIGTRPARFILENRSCQDIGKSGYRQESCRSFTWIGFHMVGRGCDFCRWFRPHIHRVSDFFPIMTTQQVTIAAVRNASNFVAMKTGALMRVWPWRLWALIELGQVTCAQTVVVPCVAAVSAGTMVPCTKLAKLEPKSDSPVRAICGVD